MKTQLESYNLINYLKIIDISILNLFDYIDLNQSNDVIEVNDKLILNFNSKCKKLLEGFVINNINDETYYGKVNILVNTCMPANNWRGGNGKSRSKIFLADTSIYIDEIKLNTFVNSLFKKLPNLNATLNKKIMYNSSVVKSVVSIHKNVKFIESNKIDQYDLYSILDNLLSSFGIVNKDGFKYNIIEDSNWALPHDGSICSELFDEVRLELIKKGII